MNVYIARFLFALTILILVSVCWYWVWFRNGAWKWGRSYVEMIESLGVNCDNFKIFMVGSPTFLKILSTIFLLFAIILVYITAQQMFSI